MAAPPNAGPSIAELCQRVLLQVEALAIASRGTSCGTIAVRAGLAMALAMPSKSKSKYSHSSGPCVKDKYAMPAQHNMSTACASSMRFLREKRSAKCPAGSASKMTGNAWIKPTNPSAHAPCAPTQAAKRGIFGYVTHSDPEELQGAVDIVLRRFAEFHRLEGALGRRALTERAKGILMERHRIDEREAFELLRSHSRRTGRKLIDVAEAVSISHLLLASQIAPVSNNSGPADPG